MRMFRRLSSVESFVGGSSDVGNKSRQSLVEDSPTSKRRIRRMSTAIDHFKDHLKEVRHKLEDKKHIKASLLKHWHQKRGFDRNSPELPYLVSVTCDYLEKNALQQEGIFRISGQLNDVLELKKKLDKGKHVELSEYSPHIVVGVLKQFFIEPEESILTEELYDSFLQAVAVKDEFERIHAISAVIYRLPVGNKVIFQRLIKLLKATASPENTAANKMTVSNLAIVFAPTLLRKESQTMDAILSDSERAKKLVEIFIQYYEELFLTTYEKKSANKYSEEMKDFFQTLKVSTVKLTQAKLKEMENLNDITEVAKANSVNEDEVDSEMLNEFYSSKLRKQNSTIELKVLKRHASQVWSDFFQAPPGITKEEEENIIKEGGGEETATNKEEENVSTKTTVEDDLAIVDPDAKALANALDSDDVDVGEVDQLVQKVGKTLQRNNSFTNAFDLLEKIKRNLVATKEVIPTHD